jgi:ribosome biogenesis protein Nip4
MGARLMLKFRLLDDSKENGLIKYLNYFDVSIFRKITNSNKFVITEGNKIEYYLVSNQIFGTYKKLKEIRNPYHVGIYFGRIKKDEFAISLNGIQIINDLTTKKIQLNHKGEVKFIYGKNINDKHIQKIYADFKIEDLMIIVNSLGEPLGLGKAITRIKQKSNKNIRIKNMLDLGWYLRKGH